MQEPFRNNIAAAANGKHDSPIGATCRCHKLQACRDVTITPLLFAYIHFVVQENMFVTDQGTKATCT